MTHQMDRGMAMLALSGYGDALSALATYKARQSHPEQVSVWDANYITTSMINDAVFDDKLKQITGDAILHYHYKCGSTRHGERISAATHFKYIINVDDDLRMINAHFELA